MVSVNESGVDRGVRVVLGVTLLWLGLMSGMVASPWSTVAWIAGAILLVTGIIGFCGIYRLFGVSTCSR